MKDIEISLQLADNSTVYPDGVLENVLFKVGKLIFLTNFYFIYREDDESLGTSEILLE